MDCALYCRLSREDGDGESESIRNQRVMLEEYARSKGWNICQVYSDQDYSGADLSRPGFRSMLRDAKEGRFQAILCKTQSRFTRDMEVVERYLHGLFPLWGIRFIAVLDGVDTASTGNKKARQINGLVNQWYLEDLSENIRAVLDNKRKAGQFIGSFAPYGYQKDPKDHNHLIPDPAAAQVVREVFRLYLSGMGIRQVAKELNRRGIPSPQKYKELQGSRYQNPSGGGGWNHTGVARILKNQMYLGTLVQGVRKKASYKSPKLLEVPEPDWIKVENTHDAIIDRESFEAAAERLKKRMRSDGTGKVHLLAGKVYCGRCGARMQRLSHRYKGVQRSYLQCSAYAADRTASDCTGQTLRLDLLEGEVTGLVSQVLAPFSGMLALSGHQDGGTLLGRQLEGLERQLRRLDRGLSTLYLDKVDGVIDPVSFQQLHKDMEEQRREIQKQAQQLRLEIEAAKTPAKPSSPAEEIPIDRLLIDLLIKRIIVWEKEPETGRQRVELYWNV